ncbi:MAG: phosphoribosylamine--glycine ligase [Deltaproteobacteria bacterium]|nr:phosphoribosylamine--glycine ligase [Deltaproteobacteria bacterium]
MKVLVVGNGGREHAMAWRLAGSPGLEVLITKGNGGTRSVARAVDTAASDIDGIVAVARREAVDLVAVGPEAPLAAGLVDRLAEAGIRAFGTDAAGARIESSKAFCHDVLDAAGVPAAGYHVFDDPDRAMAHLSSCPLPVVVKADGLAAGKGVVVATTREEALDAVRAQMVDRTLGDAGSTVVVEEFLDGEEASFMVMSDGDFVLPMATSQDHKRVFDGDKGPNTGGMGAYSPAPILDDDAERYVLDSIIRPTLAELARRGSPYKGVLYAGLMITSEGPKVLEFNCRFGDPETQPVLYRLRGDLFSAMSACADGTLSDVDLGFDPRPAVCVVLAAENYPGKPRVGDVIEGLGNAARIPHVQVFHAGTVLDDDDRAVTSGGRVLGVTAAGDTVREARDRAYKVASLIHWPGMHYRKDIAHRAL